MDDGDLIRAFQAGDESAFAELVSRHRRQVYRVARGILRSHELADEAAQEAFVKAWQALPGFRFESSFKTWMYRIAMNTAFDMRSRDAGQRRVREEAGREAIVQLRPETGSRAVDGLIADQERDLVRAAVAKLPDRQRLTLTLKVHEGLKYSEIALILACPVGTVKANFHHAVHNLRRYLGVVRGPESAGPPPASLDMGDAAGDRNDA